MIVAQFAAELRKEYRERMNEVTDALARGECTSGEIRGLALAERMLIDAAERLERTAMEK